MSSCILDYENSENQGEIEGKLQSTSQKNENAKLLINGNTIVPLKISVEDVSLLVRQYFSVLDKDKLEKYIEKFKKEMIDGKTLVKACANENFMEELIKRLDISLEDKEYFDNIVKLIRRRENELNGGKSKQDFEDGGQGSSKKSKASFNMNSFIPSKLRNKEVCDLFKEFLRDLENEDQEECIKKLKEEKISGRSLVLACEDSKIMEELTTKLGFPLDFKLRFDDMMKQIKQREKKLKEGTNDNNENKQASEISLSNRINTPKGNLQKISNSGCVIGAMYNRGHDQKINTACKYYQKNYKKSA